MGVFELDTEVAAKAKAAWEEEWKKVEAKRKVWEKAEVARAEAEKAREEEWKKVTAAWETAEEALEEVWKKVVVAKKAWAAAWAAADAWEVEEKMRTLGKE